MGSGASSSTPTSAKATGSNLIEQYDDDLLKVSLDRPEYKNGQPVLRYDDSQGRTMQVEGVPEEVIGCFTTLDKAGRVTSAPGRLFRLVLTAPTTPDHPVKVKSTAASSAAREASAETTHSSTTAAAGADRTSAAAAAATTHHRNEEDEFENDPRFRRWFFYNDTKTFNMVVTAYFGAYSQLRVLGTQAKMWRELPSGLVIAELIVPPLMTLPFVEGLMTDGYDLRFKTLEA